MLRHLNTLVLCAGALGCAMDRDAARAAVEQQPTGDSIPVPPADGADDGAQEPSAVDPMDGSSAQEDAVGGAAGAPAASSPTPGDGLPATADCGSDAAVTFRDDVQPILRSRCTDCHDDGGAASLDLRSHAAVLAGGDSGPSVVPGDCESSLLWLKTAETPPFGSRMPPDGPPWLSDSERARICDWIETGAVEASEPCDSAVADPATTDGDTTPPRFDGLDEVEERDDGCELAWSAARDDVTAPEAIVYEIHLALDGEPFDLTMPVALTEPGATSFEIDLPPGLDYVFRVIAVDGAGNRDDNDRDRECSLR